MASIDSNRFQSLIVSLSQTLLNEAMLMSFGQPTNFHNPVHK